MDIKKILHMTSETYDRLKWLICVVSPALSFALIAIGKLYGIDALSLVAATLGIVTECAGACLLISSANYAKGNIPEIVITEKGDDDE